MATKIIKEDSSSTVIVAIVAILAVLAVGFVLYSQGYFNNSETVSIDLGQGKSISATVSE